MTQTRMGLGRRGEQDVHDWLVERGWPVLTRNWRCREGEIDLVAVDGDTLVVVEVKTRWSTRAGHPLEAVTQRKLDRLYRLATLFLARERERMGLPYFSRIRVDVIGVLMGSGQPEFFPVRGAR
ncbi:YraN family protein [Brevibacterium litoralis]|uniref:YraN family protein n=1 Tax=Brevibacterium litoralis TaxID=3138935 RepID=UPI0032EE632E